MKRFWSVLALAALSLPMAHAQQKLPLRITVETKTERAENVLQRGKAVRSGHVIRHSARVTETEQQVTLTIKIMNMGVAEIKGLEVRYVLFGQEPGSDRMQIAKQGQQTIDLKSLQTQTLTTEPPAFRKSDVKFVSGAFSELNQRVGTEYRGVAIGVYRGTEQVAIHYDPQSLEQSIPVG